MNPHSTPFSRRTLLRTAAVALAAGGVGASGIVSAPRAQALGSVLGTVLDYSAGVPSAASVRAAGHKGAVRYVSAARASWMAGKPVTLAEAQDFAKQGLTTASVYQYGNADTSDWMAGAAGAAVHAPQAIALHIAAGGPTGRPIYVAIDSNPTRSEYTTYIRPYLQAFQTALALAGYSTGIYGNYSVIDWAIADELGEFFWMHDWGSNGRIHPRTTIHQLPQNLQATVGGIECDVNNVYASDWGQWTPYQEATPAPPISSPETETTPNLGGQITQAQIDQAVALIGTLSS
ncbi:DUF1906 domain-containing protein [Corynebacterium alimapuense]|uniref:Rv2525c-like glycoside hydrolase-like domain-containing protein n=1 Tax=Corynebacterium alimapuense TaxID=1576874 RepID=A0A3M8K814_9CORY|nr:DUF1906 domain-containing protein [Corynebacterium alimapuense]RNE48702.1 hypothetical protein C5L39_09130 [Corynebacterium alimapuense]